ncbi:MAG: Lrp/AsnC family transcriptional regulator [Thermoproteota archaeon]|nr:Lrp/AsnC family transcriptional regulator [Candidatus Brockarchaeota archaeon]MBO3768501.1 Lrp/AsnC family transcriptional regulator [Candidatus Brockarchaeota archaeon]MBO3801925.1 Lrp/AsnC family transcriptional regulator [Candidatus Brockarchaeota archaeon]
MDKTNYSILEILRKNARTPRTKIAKYFNMTETAIRKRIKKLELEKIIVGYRAIIDYKKVNMTCSFTGIDVKPEYLMGVIKSLRSTKKVVSLYLTSGDHDLVAEIICENMSELEKVHEQISHYEGVERICPAIVNEVVELENLAP